MREFVQFDGMRRRPRSLALAGTAVAGVALVAVAAAALAIRPGESSVPASAATPASVTVRLGARVPTSGLVSFSWSPDGSMLFVADASGGRVLDRDGRQLATFAAAEGWLDTTHLVGWDGVVSDARQSRAGTSPADVRVVASGHGAAAIVTGQATCDGDPQVRWYRLGNLDAAVERANPLGWSPDGTNILVGHAGCAAGATRWQGDVQVVDFATGKVEATLPGVTGEIAFGVEPDSVAAQAGTSIQIVDEGATTPIALAGVRFLGWLDVETMFVERSGRILVADLDPPNIPDATRYDRWQSAGPKGINLAADLDGVALAILGEDGSTLLDLSSAGLTTGVVPGLAPGSTDGLGVGMQPEWWAPDGRTLALPAADSTSLTLIAVQSAGSGSAASR